MELAGKVALVTGGAVRIGREICRALAQAGCQLVVHYHSSGEAAEDLCANLRDLGATAVAVAADLSDASACESLVHRGAEALGPLQILINNAGIFPSWSVPETHAVRWDSVMALNLRAPFLLARAFSAQLSPELSGAIINTTDARLGRSEGGHLAYQVSKGGLAILTRVLSRELAPQIRVNAVAPGSILPPPGLDEGAFMERVAERVPMGVAGGPATVAQSILFLLQEDFMNGCELRIDGGEYA